MRKPEPAPAPVNECPQCTTPIKCGRLDLSGKRGPKCVGRADGPDECDCLNRCGDDPWLKSGRSLPCRSAAAHGVPPSHGETLPRHTPAPDSVKEQNND